jgi:hypothetical protein
MFDAVPNNTVDRNLAARRHASALPADAVAVIRPNEPSAMSSGRAGARGWTLTFRPRSSPSVEPLMGWTETSDALQQVRLSFPTAEAAIRYCRRQGLSFEVQDGAGEAAYGEGEGAVRAPRAPANDRRPSRTAAEREDADRLYLAPDAVYRTPEAVLEDPSLSREQKRDLLQRWAWDEYLLEVEAGEAPVSDHVSRLAEVRAALAKLDAAHAGEGADFYRWEPPMAA